MPSQPDNDAPIAQLMAERGRNGLDSRHGFALRTRHPGAEGATVSRIDHTFRGVRIFGSESVVVTGPNGSIVSETVAERRPGLNQGDFDVAPALPSKDAIDAALAGLALNGAPIDPPAAELIIYPLMQQIRVAYAVGKAEADLNASDLEEAVSGYRLAWLVTTRMSSGSAPQFHNTIVSAADGQLLAQWSVLQSAAQSA